jgi:hypothetical protein
LIRLSSEPVADVSDLTMAKIKQMPCYPLCPIKIGDTDRVYEVAGMMVIDEHDWYLPLGEIGRRRSTRHRSDHKNAINGPLNQRTNRSRFPVRIASAICKDDRILMLRRNLFDSADHFADKGICNIGYHATDEIRPLRDQASCVQIRLITMLGGDSANSVSGVLAD